jgi:hypothetical protein
MKLFRRNKPSELTIRTEELQVGDRFAYEGTLVKVDQLRTGPDKDKTYLRLEVLHPLDRTVWNYRSVATYNELLITVIR